MSNMHDAMETWAQGPGKRVAQSLEERDGLAAARAGISRGRRRRAVGGTVSAFAVVGALVLAVGVLPGLGGASSIGPGVSTEVHQGEVALVADALPEGEGVQPFVCGEEFVPWAEPGITYSGFEPDAPVTFSGELGLVVGTGESSDDLALVSPESATDLGIGQGDTVRAWLEVSYGDALLDAQGRQLYDVAVHTALVKNGVVVNVPALTTYAKNGQFQERHGVAYALGIDPFPAHVLAAGSDATGASAVLGAWDGCAPQCPPDTDCEVPVLQPGEYAIHTVVQVFDPLTLEVMVTAVDAVDLGADVLVVLDPGYDESPETASAVYDGWVVPATTVSSCTPHRNHIGTVKMHTDEATQVEVVLDGVDLNHFEVVASVHVPEGEDPPWFVEEHAWLVVQKGSISKKAPYLTWREEPGAQGGTTWSLSSADESDRDPTAYPAHCIITAEYQPAEGEVWLAIAGSGEVPVTDDQNWETWVYLGEIEAEAWELPENDLNDPDTLPWHREEHAPSAGQFDDPDSGTYSGRVVPATPVSCEAHRWHLISVIADREAPQMPVAMELADVTDYLETVASVHVPAGEAPPWFVNEYAWLVFEYNQKFGVFLEWRDTPGPDGGTNWMLQYAEDRNQDRSMPEGGCNITFEGLPPPAGQAWLVMSGSGDMPVTNDQDWETWVYLGEIAPDEKWTD